MSNGVEQHEISPEDLTLYALGSLDGPELARISRHLESCASCRLEIQRLNADIGAYAMAAAPEAQPAPRVKDRLMAHVNRAEKREAMHRAWNWSFAFGIAVASVLVIAVILGWQGFQSLRRENAQLRVELQKLRADSDQAKAIVDTIKSADTMNVMLVARNPMHQPMAHAFYSKDKGRVFLMATNIAPLGPDKMYELWLLPKSGKPIPAGMFQADSGWHAQMLHEGLPAGMDAEGFAITIEPAEGSLAPSKEPFLVGKVG